MSIRNKEHAYDPVGADNFKRNFPEGKIANGSINYVENVEEALKGANICFIFTEWGEIKAVMPEDYKKLMRTPLVYDGRNILQIIQCRYMLLRRNQMS